MWPIKSQHLLQLGSKVYYTEQETPVTIVKDGNLEPHFLQELLKFSFCLGVHFLFHPVIELVPTMLYCTEVDGNSHFRQLQFTSTSSKFQFCTEVWLTYMQSFINCLRAKFANMSLVLGCLAVTMLKRSPFVVQQSLPCWRIMNSWFKTFLTWINRDVSHVMNVLLPL